MLVGELSRGRGGIRIRGLRRRTAACAALLVASLIAPLGPEPGTRPASAIGPRPSRPGAAPHDQPKRDERLDRTPAAGAAGEQGENGSAAYKQRGIALGMFAEDVSFSYAPLLKEIAAFGATHVALVVPLYQSNARTNDLGLHTRLSPTLSLLADTIREARHQHLEVTVFPIVRLARPAAGEWRGTLAPTNRRLWFRNYGELLGDLGAVAAQTGASRLVIGSELSSLDGDLESWRPLVERIRAVFPGRLVYSANWDHYQSASLFELVDEEGITGYFELRADARAPSDNAALEAAWHRVKGEILAWRQGRTRPFLFTELGYRSRAGSTARPWDEAPGGRPDVDEQRRAFAAFRRVWAKTPGLDGVYIWNWYGWGGPESLGYVPRDKPAAAEVRQLLEDL